MAEQANQAPSPDRREFLRVAVYGSTGLLLAGAMAAAPAAARRGPAGEAGLLPLLPLARLGTLEKGKPIALEVALSFGDGWRLRARRAPLFVQRVADGDRAEAFKALSAVCPHAGCTVRLQGEELACPCHDGHFALDGAVKSGPSPRPLDALEVSVADRDGAPWLFVKWQDFMPGRTERVAQASG